jgi:hypothetical protein
MKKQKEGNRKKQSLLGCLASLLQKLFSLIKGLVILLAIVFVVLSIIKYRGCFSSEVTAYSIQCKEKPIGNYCEEPEYVITPIYYEVDADNQIVLCWIKGFEIEKLTKCAIKDRYNWTCKYNDESAKFGFRNGSYFYYSLQDSNDRPDEFNECYVSRYKYLEVYCKDKKSELRKYGCMALVNLLLEYM